MKTEEIIKECKNCDALGFDSEIDVYYCCLSHRQDDLPKEFTCDDFVPNKQLLRLEQENKELKEENIKVKKEFNNLIAEIISDMEYTGEIACNGESPKEHLHQMQKALSALEEIKKAIKSYDLAVDNGVSVDTLYTIGKIINEVLK